MSLYQQPGPALLEVLEEAYEIDSELLYDNCDGTCTTGYDNDGSTGLDIFENGLSLAFTARDSRLVGFIPDGLNVAFFFVGNDDTIRERIQEVIGEAN
jgi:hypothetical protein